MSGSADPRLTGVDHVVDHPAFRGYSGQRFPSGDVSPVQKHQQRVEPERLFPGRGGVFLVVGVVDGDAAQLRRRRPRPGDKWHLDEVFVKINGTTYYL